MYLKIFNAAHKTLFIGKQLVPSSGKQPYRKIGFDQSPPAEARNMAMVAKQREPGSPREANRKAKAALDLLAKTREKRKQSPSFKEKSGGNEPYYDPASPRSGLHPEVLAIRAKTLEKVRLSFTVDPQPCTRENKVTAPIATEEAHKKK